MMANLKLLLLAPHRIDSNLRGVIVDDPKLVHEVLDHVLAQKNTSRMVVGLQPEVVSEEEAKALFSEEPPSPPPSVPEEPPKPPSPTITPLRAHDVGEEPELTHA